MADVLETAPAARGQWGSRWGFILAAAGSAVGLGNIWKFPYITGENGGGLFVLIYLFCIALVGVPIMVAEILIGRAAQKQPVMAFNTLQGGRSPWAVVGWMGVITGFIILSYYIVVAGWAMDYTLKSVVNFTNPIAEQALVESKKARVSVPIEEMREDLIARHAEKLAKERLSDIESEAKPSVWKDFAVYQAAHEHGGESDVARAILFEDPVLRERVEIAEMLRARMDTVVTETENEAHQHYAALGETQIRDEAEVIYRRGFIAEEVGAAFGGLYVDGWTATFWSGLFILLTILIVAGGISSGIERACKILMPTLGAIIGFMVIYGFFQPGFGEAFAFVFKPDIHKLHPSGVLEALGHAFFTLSLGMGAMITYGSYQQSRSRGLASEAITISVLDTLIALGACLMIFPIIFSYGQEPSAGPGLVFVSMPLAFAEIGAGGMLLAILFFGLLVFAALTSSISLLEVLCSYFIDARSWSRHKAAWVLGIIVFLFGVPAGFAASDSFALSSWEAGFGKNYFDTMDYLASNWMLPLGGLLISIYAGWIMPRRLRDAELEGLAPGLIWCWVGLVRFVAPALVFLVLLSKVGVLNVDEFFGGLGP